MILVSMEPEDLSTGQVIMKYVSSACIFLLALALVIYLLNYKNSHIVTDSGILQPLNSQTAAAVLNSLSAEERAQLAPMLTPTTPQ